MNESKATAVGRVDAAAQIVPVLDLVYRLIANYAVEDRRRGGPAVSLQEQETAAEPGHEQAQEVFVHRAQLRMIRQHIQQLGAPGNQVVGGAGSLIEGWVLDGFWTPTHGWVLDTHTLWWVLDTHTLSLYQAIDMGLVGKH